MNQALYAHMNSKRKRKKKSIVTPAYFGGDIVLENLLAAFYPSQCSFLSIRWVSCKQQIVRASFLIQFAKWFLLMRQLSSLTFSVNIDIYW
jgi:hypothetical protein